MLKPSRKHYPHWDLILSVLMLTALVLVMSPAHADMQYQQPEEVGTGQLLQRTETGYLTLPLLNSHFDVDVSGLVAQVHLQQQFRNNSADWIEAEYVFPLPDQAAVNAMEIRLGERIIKGSVKEKAAAQREYIQARSEGRRAGLVEQQRPNLFTTRVANIGPGEEVDVTVTFVMTLRYDQGRFELRLPTTLTPRFIPGVANHNTELLLQGNGWASNTDQVSDAANITPPQISAARTGSHQAEIQVELMPGFEVTQLQSPYHSIATQQHGNRYHVEPAGGAIDMKRDFVLRWQPLAEQAPVAAVFEETVNDDYHALVMMLPPVDEATLHIPPRELILIIDTSGSMAGESMPQAIQALRYALQQLRPQDAFNVIEFNSVHRSLFTSSVPVNPANLQQAQEFVASLHADGGTEMLPALQAAFTSTTLPEHLRQVVFVTDGSVGNETALFKLIEDRIGAGRLYTVGIGSAPNQYFMRKAAEFGRGTFSLIGSTAEVKAQMQTLFEKIKRPVVTQIQLETDSTCDEIFPQPLPDLFAGEPLLINLHCGQRPQQVMISGIFQGQAWQSRLQLASEQVDNGGIATLWARAKVAHLQDEGIRLGNNAHFKPDIISVGIDYQIITPFTSFVAVEQEVARPANEEVSTRPGPNLMPQGSQLAAPAVGYPRTALNLEWHWLLGLLAMLGAVLVWQRLEFREWTQAC